MNKDIDKINKYFIEDKIIDSNMEIICNFVGPSFKLNVKDVLGSIFQEWFYQYLNNKGIAWKSPENTQQYPDVILPNNHYLELKTFNYDASPGFDLANFKSFINDLIINPKRLDSDYLIFGYQVLDKKIILKKYWIKKIWDITRIPKAGSTRGLITAQVKKGIVYNLRPYKFYTGDAEKLSIKSRKDFVIQLKKFIGDSRYISQCINKNDSFFSPEDWFNKVSSKYLNQTGTEL